MPGVPAPAEVADPRQLESLYLECWSDVPQGKGFTKPGRQILHCTFGSVLTTKDAAGKYVFKDRILAVLKNNEEAHYAVLERHLGRHVKPFAKQ